MSDILARRRSGLIESLEQARIRRDSQNPTALSRRFLDLDLGEMSPERLLKLDDPQDMLKRLAFDVPAIDIAYLRIVELVPVLPDSEHRQVMLRLGASALMFEYGIYSFIASSVITRDLPTGLQMDSGPITVESSEYAAIGTIADSFGV